VNAPNATLSVSKGVNAMMVSVSVMMDKMEYFVKIVNVPMIVMGMVSV